MLGSGTALPTHLDRKAELDARYVQAIQNGTFKPFTYPCGSYGVFLVILFLLIPHRNRPLLQKCRYLVWAINTAYAVWVIACTRARWPSLSYSVGLGTAWGVLWTTTCLAAYDGQLQFSRIERVAGATMMLGESTSTQEASQKREDGVANESLQRNAEAAPIFITDLSWEDYPERSFFERLDWVLDLMSNFRGMAWNWRIPSLPDPPKQVQEILRRSTTGDRKKLAKARPPFQPKSREQVLSRAWRTFVAGYLILDLVRTLMIHDPFFRGLGAEHVPTYLPLFIQNSPVLLRSYRLLIALAAVYWALNFLFQLAPIFFVGVLGSKRIGVRGEVWMYPQEWGSYTTVLDRGLAAFWGEWWHQTFRFAFEACTAFIVKAVGLGESRTMIAKTTKLFIAFALSGCLHASGSHASMGDTRPIRGPFLFFILQPVGIIGQMLAAKALQRVGVTARTPKLLQRLTNLIVVNTWLYHTAPLLVGDLAAGGQFLYEPIPVSLFRYLGFGGQGDSWSCWQGTWLVWHKGETWWQSGIGT